MVKAVAHVEATAVPIVVPAAAAAVEPAVAVTNLEITKMTGQSGHFLFKH